MKKIATLVFPGMHGNAVLLEDFQQLAPPQFDVFTHELPSDEWRYEHLAEHFDGAVSTHQRCMLIGESFSGPLVVKLAARYPHIVSRVILVASFVTPPTPLLARFLPWSWLMKFPMSESTVEHWMLGKGHDKAFVNHVRQQVDSAPARTMAGRMRQIIHINATDDLQKLKCPLLYLRATNDRIVPTKCGDRVKELYSECELTSLPGTHLILQTHATEAWEQISQFAEK